MPDSISTDAAPSAIGPYSQAVVHNQTVYISGQIPLDPHTMALVSDDIKEQIKQAFANLSAICRAAGGDLDQVLKFTVYLTSLEHFPLVNEHMADILTPPFPARAAVEVSALPKAAQIEIDAIMAIPPE